MAEDDVPAADGDESAPSAPAARGPRDWTLPLLVLLVAVSLVLRMAWLSKPSGLLIFDESYYVNAARVMRGIASADAAHYANAPAGLDPNFEHPPLVKALIAGSMSLFGDNAYGWRVPSIIAGTLCLPLLFLVSLRITEDRSTSLVATFIFAFDNLVFVHSRIATLDIFVLAFMLLGLYFYLCERPLVAAFGLAGATMCKVSGLYAVAAIVLYVLLRIRQERLRTGRWELAPLRLLLVMCGAYVAMSVAFLGILDRLYTSYTNPLAHFQRILEYGMSLTRAGGPENQESHPWQWLLNDVQMTYARTDVQVKVADKVIRTKATINFRGAMNPYVIGAAPIAVAYAVHRMLAKSDPVATLVVAWTAALYAPFYFAAILAHRISYIYYFLPVLPAVALGTAQILTSKKTPPAVRWVYLGAVLLGFVGYFPFRSIPR